MPPRPSSPTTRYRPREGVSFTVRTSREDPRGALILCVPPRPRCYAAAMQRVLGVAGWSGSGKTTLLVALVRLLVDEGLAVAVMKHDAHGLDAGEARRDSERLHAAGAAVLAVGPGEGLARWRV